MLLSDWCSTGWLSSFNALVTLMCAQLLLQVMTHLKAFTRCKFTSSFQMHAQINQGSEQLPSLWRYELT